MKIISIITGLLTLTVALFSFVVSFVSLQTIAKENQFPIPALFPLTIEAGVIIFSINALYRHLNGEKAFWQWGLVILSSGLALTFNVLHAQDNLISQIMFGIPSLFFLLSFENFISQVKYVVKKKLEKQETLDGFNSLLMLKQKELKEAEEKSKAVQIDLNQSQITLEENQKQLKQFESRTQKYKEEIQALKSELKEVKKDSSRLQLILDSIKNGNLKVENLSKELEVTPQTIYNDLKKLEQNNLIIKNGKGWAIV